MAAAQPIRSPMPGIVGPASHESRQAVVIPRAAAANGSMDWVRWQVVIPIRPDGAGKSRLRGATAQDELHDHLVHAIQRDTLEAVAHARELAGELAGEVVVAGISVVSHSALSDIPTGTGVIPDAGGGLNAAIAGAAATLSSRHPRDAIVALVADLPSLTPQDFLAVLRAAGEVDRGFVADHDGSGTTMLTARPGLALAPSFGPGSAAEHALSGAVALAAAPSARCDVDTAADLARCLDLGVGPRTAAFASLLHPFT